MTAEVWVRLRDGRDGPESAEGIAEVSLHLVDALGEANCLCSSRVHDAIHAEVELRLIQLEELQEEGLQLLEVLANEL